MSCQPWSSARRCSTRRVCPDHHQHSLGCLTMLHLQIHTAYTQPPFFYRAYSVTWCVYPLSAVIVTSYLNMSSAT